MELPELKSSILKKDIKSFLIFTGLEYALKDIYVKEIAKRLELTIKRTTFTEVLKPNKGLLTEEHYLYIIENENISDIDPIRLDSKYIIYLVDSLDKRTKLYKDYQENIVEFNYLDNNTLLSIISSKFDITDNQINWLIDACNNNYGKCLQELEKLKIFRDDYNEKENQVELFKYLQENNGFHVETPNVLFKFIDSVGLRNKKDSWKFYNILEKIGENKIELIALLYNKFRSTLIVQMINNPTMEATGLTNYQIYQGKQCKGIYTDNELFKALDTLRQLDLDIKTGELDEMISVKYFLTKVL